MSAAGTAAQGRRAAEALMTDTCTIIRLAQRGTLDPNTGQMIHPETLIYQGKCRVKAEAGTSVGDVGVGETAVARVTPIVSVPLTVTAVRAGDRIRVQVSADDHLDERLMMVRAVQSGTHITARRLICEVL
jgi:hypothetical protein